MDGCGLHAHPHLAAARRRRGQPLTVPAAGTDRRRAVFGALDHARGRLCRQLHDAKGGDAFAAFPARIAQTWPDEPPILVMDNVSHHRAPAVRARWAAQQGRITPFRLPAYAPTLNLVERVWRFLKQKPARHRCWADAAGLTAAAATLLARVQARFHTDHPPAIPLGQDFCEAA